MRKVRSARNKIMLHPMMAFLLLTLIVIVLSGILNLFGASESYNTVNSVTNAYQSNLVTIESLFSLRGLKYIFSNTVSNFASFAPLIMLLIALIGIGILEESGFLSSFFFVITKNVPRYIVTFCLVLLCIIFSISGDISYVVFIPIAASLFKHGRRNPLVGIIASFIAVSVGFGINLTMSGIDSALANNTTLSASIIGAYSMNSNSYLIIMILATIVSSIIITYVTESITVPRLGRFEIDEDEITVDKDKLTKKEARGLLFAGAGFVLYLIILIYNMIPYIPFGGNFLDYSQTRYIDKLFGANSFFNSGFIFVITFMFFLVGFLYGIGAKTIENHRDVCDFLSKSLDGIGKVIILIFFSSVFVSLYKYTNIGSLITAFFSNMIYKSNFTGLPLVALVIFVSIISTIFMPSLTARWEILSGTVVPLLMTSGYTPEYAQLLFSTCGTILYGLTPVMAYFVIYLAYLEKFDKTGAGVMKSIRYLIPYALFLLGMWIIILLIWTIVKLPLGIGTGVLL